MNLISGEFYHIYNRGNNKQSIFFNDNNYLFFLNKVREQIYPLQILFAIVRCQIIFTLLFKRMKKA